MNSEEIVQAQRSLRASLLDGRQPATMQGSSDLAAHLLLYLDDTARCWQLTLEWLRHGLDADRVDGGFVSPGLAIYRPVAETVRGGLQMPTSVGAAIDVSDDSVRDVLSSPNAVVFESVQADPRFTSSLRSTLLSLNTRAKLGVSLRHGKIPIGLICCDWARERRHWSAEEYWQVSQVASSVLSPIFSTAYQAAGERNEALSDAADEGDAPVVDAGPFGLTRGELQVARLVVTGMSYKEIANRLNRSFSTVDHRLRSIRYKLGARSTARMLVILSDLLARQPAG